MSDAREVVEADGEIVDAETGEIVGQPQVPAAQAHGARSVTEVLEHISSPEALEEQKALMAAYDEACEALIGPNDVQQEGDRTFKKKSAWRKLARHFGISTEVLQAETWWETNDWEDRPHCVSRVTVRAVAPWGQYMTAVGKCSTREKRFKYENNRQKADHDCEATAQTRASNRAVSDLIAAGEVSAEEVEGGGSYDRDQSQGFDRQCPECGSEVWDNRPKIEAGEWKENAPRFTCKDKDGCGWKSWDTEEEVWGVVLPERIEAALQELADLNPDRAATARSMVEDRVGRLRSNDEAASNAAEKLERAVSEEQSNGGAPSEESGEGGASSDVPGEPAAKEAVERRLSEEYGTGAVMGKLTEFGFKHPALSASPEDWTEPEWAEVLEGLEAHGMTYIEAPDEVLSGEGAA